MRYDGQTGALIDAFVTAGSGGLDAPVGLAFFPTPPCAGGSGQDCNHNGIDDFCEIADGAPDANANGIPDVCEYAAPEPPLATGEEARTNRYLRFLAPPPAIAGVVEEVVRIRIVSLDGHPAPSPDVLYLGPPVAAPEEDTTQPGLTFAVAPLSCDPYAHAWSAEGIISAYGAELMPGSEYEIQRAGASCADLQTNEACWSAPLTITTATYGDIVTPFDGSGPVQPDFGDITAMVSKFLAEAGAPIKAVAQLQPNIVYPHRPIDFNDISDAVGAFLGTAYASRYPGPCTCPSIVTCGATPCTNDPQCGDGLCMNGFCADACGRCAP